MNLLAHAYLSGDNDYLLIGNFIADHIKGKHPASFPADVIKGINLHRDIDYYTDQHPVFNRSCNLLYSTYHKYAGVVVDMVYDHFLARHWNQYHKQSLEEFTGYCYSVLLRNYNILPQRTKSLLPNIIMDNWLTAYAHLEGLEKSFTGISRRAKYNPGLENAVVDIKKHYGQLEKDFSDFFPDLVFFTNKRIFDLDATPVKLTAKMRRKKRTMRIMQLLGRKSLDSSSETK